MSTASAALNVLVAALMLLKSWDVSMCQLRLISASQLLVDFSLTVLCLEQIKPILLPSTIYH